MANFHRFLQDSVQTKSQVMLSSETVAAARLLDCQKYLIQLSTHYVSFTTK